MKQIRAFFTLLLATIMYGLSTGEVACAQIMHTPVNTALGGGGTAYTTGYESLFINPANLYIREKEYKLQIAAGSAGGFMSSPEKSRGIHDFLDGYRLQFQQYQPVPEETGEGMNYERVLDRNFETDGLFSEHQSVGELHWIGMHWTHLDKSYAIAVRTRFANRYLTGRGFYDPDPVEAGGYYQADRSLTHQFQSLHEFSFGYSESFTFINRLIPQLSQLIIGIAPKFVLSGAYLNAQYKDRFRSDAGEADYMRSRSYSRYSAGAFSSANQRFPEGQSLPGAESGRLDLFRPAGAGAGLDLGLTYLITLGDDISVVRTESSRTRKSLRLSFSITDIGFVNYFDNPAEYTSPQRQSREDALPDRSDRVFRGKPGEDLFFLDRNGHFPLSESASRKDDSFAVLLPTALHGGVLFQISRFKLMGDMSLGLTHNAFNSTRLTTYMGTEIRPLSFLPLRAGIRISSDLPDYYSIGAGIETGYFEVNASLQIRNRSIGPANEIAGFSVGAVKIYIP
ncbi:MAG: DUF5723 family protein [Balneolaceae bacterium]